MASVEDNTFMADLLGEVDVNIQPQAPLRTIKTTSRRKTRVLSPPISETRKVFPPKEIDSNPSAALLNTPPSEARKDDESFFGALEDDAFPAGDLAMSSPTIGAADRKGFPTVKVEEDEDDVMEVAEAVGDAGKQVANINISGSRPPKKIVKAPSYPTPASSSPTRPPATDMDAPSWNEITSKLNVVKTKEAQTASFGKLSIEDAVEDDGSLRIFWTDYTEVEGSLCLFGKVKNQKTGCFVSAFVKIDNILRKLYFLPRTFRQSE